VGGIARHVTWLTAGLEHLGYETLLVTGSVPPGEEDMIAFASAQGVVPLVVPQMSREVSVKDFVTVWKLYRLFMRVRPNVVHTHGAKAGTVGRLAGLLYWWFTPLALLGRRRRCRFVHTFHGHIFHSYYGRLKTAFFLAVEKALARVATDRIVVISPQQFREIHERYGVGRTEQFAVIPLGLDVRAFDGSARRRHLLRDELGAAAADLLVGIVGRLTEIKNHSLFLRIAALFKQRREGTAGRRVRFLIIGNGHLRGPLESEAQELGLEESVLFLGNRDDPENFYPALDVVALTSHNEGTPLTLIEAMANARAVISTNVGGVVDLLGTSATANVSDGWAVCERGLLVRPGDAEAFCAGLGRLLADRGLRRDLGERGRRFIAANYTKERLLADVARLYDGLLSARPEREARLKPLATQGQHA
jgi:glycosyltransferase involved in cell wall biosynthesis